MSYSSKHAWAVSVQYAICAYFKRNTKPDHMVPTTLLHSTTQDALFLLKQTKQLQPTVAMVPYVLPCLIVLCASDNDVKPPTCTVFLFFFYFYFFLFFIFFYFFTICCQYICLHTVMSLQSTECALITSVGRYISVHLQFPLSKCLQPGRITPII